MKITFRIDAHYVLTQQDEQPINGMTHWRLYRNGKDIAVTRGRVSFEKALAWAREYISEE